PPARQTAYADETLGVAHDGGPGDCGKMAVCTGGRRWNPRARYLDLAGSPDCVGVGLFARDNGRPVRIPAGGRVARTLPLLRGRRRPAHARGITDMMIFEREGALTRELLLAPGGFGLGQVPQDERPDATTTM